MHEIKIKNMVNTIFIYTRTHNWDCNIKEKLPVYQYNIQGVFMF